MHAGPAWVRAGVLQRLGTALTCNGRTLILWGVVQKHSHPPLIPTAAGHELAAAVAVSNVTHRGVVYSAEIVKPAKNVPQEKENSCGSPRLAQGSPAPAGGSRQDLHAPTPVSLGTVIYQLPTSHSSWIPSSKNFFHSAQYFFP